MDIVAERDMLGLTVGVETVSGDGEGLREREGEVEVTGGASWDDMSEDVREIGEIPDAI